jgi:hypothetical protein
VLFNDVSWGLRVIECVGIDRAKWRSTSNSGICLEGSRKSTEPVMVTRVSVESRTENLRTTRQALHLEPYRGIGGRYSDSGVAAYPGMWRRVFGRLFWVKHTSSDWLTDLTEHSDWEADSFSAGQEISLTLWNQKVRYRFWQQSARIVSQINPVCALSSSSVIYFNIILSKFRFSIWSLSFKFSYQNSSCISLLPTHFTCPACLITLDLMTECSFFSVPEPNWAAVFWTPSFMFMYDYPDVFPCFSLSCKANARVKPANTGHSPHSS